MFLSRIELDLGKYETRRAISTPQVIHAAVENCFPDKEEKDRKLWRLDRLHGRLYLIVLSPEKPDFASLARQFCAASTYGETKDYLPLLQQMREGSRLRFRLRANPIHNVTTEKGVRGKVYAHVTVAQKRDWLMKKAETCGFKLDDDQFDVVETDYLRFWRNRKEQPVVIDTAVFEGFLDVTDADAFIATLTKGVGRAKAYGCGLLTVAGVR